MKRFYFFLAVLLIHTYVSFAQSDNGNLAGVIKDSTGTPVANATIRIEGTSFQATTNDKGKFRITNIPSGKYTITISMLGYDDKKQEIVVEENKTTSLNTVLKEGIHELEEVRLVAKSKNEEIMEQGFAVNVIDAKALQNRNIDVNKALTQSSGVRIRQDAGLGSSFNLTMNGLKGSQFINGIPMEVFGTAYGFNNIPINQVERIEVYKGVVPAHLGGDALGGAINLVTRTKLSNALNASYSYGSFNTHRASLNGTLRDSTTGLTVIASSYLNYSDNNYRMRDMDILENSYYVKKNVKRFHDQYFSYAGRIEAGLTGKKYADALLLGVGYAEMQKDVQTGPTQYPAAGDVTGDEKNYQASVNYRKTGILKDRFDVNLFFLRNQSNTTFTDTSSKSYQWDGSVLFQRPANSLVGELGDKQIFKTNQTDLVHRYIVSYHLHRNHTFSLNYTSTFSIRKSVDEWAKSHGLNAFETKNEYQKTVAALGYDLKLFSQKLQSSIFGKMYHAKADVEDGLSWENGYFRSHGLQTNKTYWGGGIGTSFAFSKRILIKTSMEYAYRIPTIYELLGDGISTIANTNLLPESSMNYNVGYTVKIIENAKVGIQWNSTGFYRDANNFIRAIPAGKRVTHTNFDKVLIRGVESEIRMALNKRFFFSINGTYQQVLDNNRYVGNTNIENYTYQQQLPNTPHLFGNIDMSYTSFKITDNLKLAPYYSLLYVPEFYLGFANVAKGSAKFVIPTQLVQDLGITLSIPRNLLAITFECTNFTNVLAYDNFRLQKPGRAYSVKVNFNLNQK